MLYDVTSTYFEGLAEGNELAARGHSRDSRSDCKQVCIGLVVTRDGFPVAYEVFAGNRTDVTTVEEIVEAMEKRHGKASRVWVMDRGMTSERNLQWLREGGRSYLVGTPKSELKRFERELIEEAGWKKVRAGLEVKLCEGCNGAETFILCRSEDRQKKEAAMHERFSERIEEGLSQLGRRIERSKQPLDKLEIGQQIGRLFAKNSRAAAKFKVEVVDDKTMPAGFRLHVTKNQKWSDWAALTEGSYILRSNVANWSPEELWRTYIQLTHAEAAFRIQKSDLSIRPIWHHRADRVEGHILICFLAYAMWKLLDGWSQRAGIGASARKVLEEMRRLSSVDVLLPLHDGPEHRLRCVLRPDDGQAMLLDRLGLRLPQRLRPNRRVPRM